jgi:hypothetical protein
METVANARCRSALRDSGVPVLAKRGASVSADPTGSRRFAVATRIEFKHDMRRKVRDTQTQVNRERPKRQSDNKEKRRSMKKQARWRGAGYAQITALATSALPSGVGDLCGWPDLLRIGAGHHRGRDGMRLAPPKQRRRAGGRIKTDARDATHPARLLSLGEIIVVTAPGGEIESVRDLVVRVDLMRADRLCRRGLTLDRVTAPVQRHASA